MYIYYSRLIEKDPEKLKQKAAGIYYIDIDQTYIHRSRYTYMEPTDNYDQTQLRGIIRKGSWTREEDLLLRKCIEKYGEGNWNQIPARAGLHRCRKSCRLRWLNYLQPNIKQGEFAMDEVDLIIRMHKLLGNKWSLIAGRLPGRTANGIKNYWNTHLKQSKQRPESNVTMNISKADDKQIIRNDHQNKVLVIRPQPQKISENSKGIKKKSILMHMSTDIEQPTSPKMVTKSTDHSHEPLPMFLTDDALITSWWQENIDAFIDHDDHRMKEGVVLLAEKAINSGCCCRCRCNKSITTDDQSTKSQQDLCVDDYLLNELQNIPW